MITIPYRSAVGTLMWLMVYTRPDLTFAVIQVAKFVSSPRKEHWIAVKRIMRYLSRTREVGITYYPNPSFIIEGWSDSDWAGDLDTRRSTSGFVFTIAGTVAQSPVAWKSQLKKTVALSSTEAELIALTNTTKEAIWFRKLLACLGLSIKEPTLIHEDNQGAMAIAVNQRGMTSRTKHVATRYFAVRGAIDDGAVQVTYTNTLEMLADIFTKAVGRIVLERLCTAMGMQLSKAQHRDQP